MKPGIISAFFFCGILALGAGACAYKEPAAFPVYAPSGPPSTLWGLSKNSAAGIIPLDGSKPLNYRFQKPLSLPPDMSLELEYGFRLGDGPAGNLSAWKDRYRIVLRVEGEAPWELPWDGSFLGAGKVPEKIRYGIPLLGSEIEQFSLTLETREDAGPSPAGGKGLVFAIRSLRFLPRWFGFVREGEGAAAALGVTPFVSGGIVAGQGGPVQTVLIDPLLPYRIPGPVELSLSGEAAPVEVALGRVRYEYAGGPEPGPIHLPAGAVPGEPYPLVVTGDGQIDTLRLVKAPALPFPEAIPADPGVILVYDRTLWRDPRYEVFQWEHFPSVLIFDTADYAVQDRLFKRIAFFVEKKGIAGRLLTDREMADLHGWNAHDYRAEDLAAFFSAARTKNFPLSPEEEELENILHGAGILTPAGPGAGAVLSLSRESSDYLRGLFMVHEGFHGLFFIDADFREFCRRRWEGLDPGARRFLRSYFDYQGYEVNNPLLVINEFMAHCLQQPVSRAGWYFGEVLAGRINESSWRREVLPPMDEASGTWPDLSRAFMREAEALSSYVNRRWGFTAGRIRRLIPLFQD
ncbi:hypothetical protein LQZ21_11800 [Treponema sp. TIM-1]|uniref:hypothetical protein n=1 Tax=Treponema sp. TIM-1 TaxID=2898417 RepID=UPI003980F673